VRNPPVLVVSSRFSGARSANGTADAAIRHQCDAIAAQARQDNDAFLRRVR
jgi:hypothetical protein